MSILFDAKFTLGKHWIFNLTATDGDGTIIDLTSATIKMKIGTKTGTVLDTRQTGGAGIVIVTATAGTYTVTVTPTNQTTATLAASTDYNYEVELTTGGGIVFDQLEGNLHVRPSMFP